MGGGATGGGGGGPDGGTGGGSTGGGSTGGGSGGGGTTVDAGPPFQTDAGEVLVLGTLVPGMPQFALAALSSPKSPVVGLSAGTVTRTAQLDAFGHLMYFDNLTHSLRMMVPEPFAHDGGGAAYPPNPSANDVLLDTSMCGANAVAGFWMRPDSESFIYACGMTGPYFEGAQALPELTGYSVMAAGVGNVFVLDSSDQGHTFDDAGIHDVFIGESLSSLSLNSRYREVRSTSDGGYWVLRGTMTNEITGPCVLYFIDGSTGDSTQVGTYTDLGSATAPLSCTGRLDGQGRLYTPGTNGSSHVVVLRPFVLPSGSTSTVYTESGAAASSFNAYPPNVFTFFDTQSSLVAGP
jgi:hypothetical protein